VALGLTACGGDDSEPEKAAKEPEVAAPASTVEVGIGGPVRFDKKRYTAKAGAVEIELTTDKGGIGHNARLQPADKPCCTEHDIGGTNTISDGQVHAATVELQPGKYTIYCSIGGHWQRGMKAALVVD
jgi:uncharacterized cupredoxin-like copper-binding protein